jgi:hypothetical protein
MVFLKKKNWCNYINRNNKNQFPGTPKHSTPPAFQSWQFALLPVSKYAIPEKMLQSQEYF